MQTIANLTWLRGDLHNCLGSTDNENFGRSSEKCYVISNDCSFREGLMFGGNCLAIGSEEMGVDFSYS